MPKLTTITLPTDLIIGVDDFDKFTIDAEKLFIAGSGGTGRTDTVILIPRHRPTLIELFVTVSQQGSSDEAVRMDRVRMKNDVGTVTANDFTNIYDSRDFGNIPAVVPFINVAAEGVQFDLTNPAAEANLEWTFFYKVYIHGQ